MCKDKNILQNCLAILRPHKAIVLLSIFLSLFATIMTVMIPLLSQHLIDYGLLPLNLKIITGVAILIIILSAIQRVMSSAQTYLHVKVQNRILLKLSEEAIVQTVKLKMKYFESNEYLEKVVAVNRYIHEISEIASEQFLGIFVQIVKFLGGIVGLMIINTNLGFIVLFLASIRYFIMIRLKKQRDKSIEDYIALNNKYSVWYTDLINGIRTVKLWNLNKVTENYENLAKQLNIQKHLAMLDIIESFLSDFIFLVMNYGLYIIGAIVIVNGQLTIGGLFAFIMYAELVIQPIFHLVILNTKLSSIRPALNGFMEFMELETEITGTNLINNAKVNEIRFNNVSWDFDNKRILTDISFCINNGEKIALVGLNGSGKSSLLDILLRMREPTCGYISLNGLDIQHYNLYDYRMLFSVIDQNSFLFDGSVEDNLFLDNQNVCAERSEIIEWFFSQVLKLSDGLKTKTGQKGMLLSGGERQKIALLRSMLKEKSKILLLDEATANYDLESEKVFNEFVLKENKYDVIIIVTHRPDILSCVDKIIVLDNGTITAVGSYEELCYQEDFKKYLNL